MELVMNGYLPGPANLFNPLPIPLRLARVFRNWVSQSLRDPTRYPPLPVDGWFVSPQTPLVTYGSDDSSTTSGHIVLFYPDQVLLPMDPSPSSWLETLAISGRLGVSFAKSTFPFPHPPTPLSPPTPLLVAPPPPSPPVPRYVPPISEQHHREEWMRQLAAIEQANSLQPPSPILPMALEQELNAVSPQDLSNMLPPESLFSDL